MENLTQEQVVFVHTNKETQLEEPMFKKMLFLGWADHVIVAYEPLPIMDSEGKVVSYDTYAKHLNETVAICKNIDGSIEKIKPEYLTFE